MREYKIIESDFSPSGLARKVEVAIKEGWTPQGGAATYTTNAGYVYYLQAVTR